MSMTAHDLSAWLTLIIVLKGVCFSGIWDDTRQISIERFLCLKTLPHKGEARKLVAEQGVHIECQQKKETVYVLLMSAFHTTFGL